MDQDVCQNGTNQGHDLGSGVALPAAASGICADKADQHNDYARAELERPSFLPWMMSGMVMSRYATNAVVLQSRNTGLEKLFFLYVQSIQKSSVQKYE